MLPGRVIRVAQGPLLIIDGTDCNLDTSSREHAKDMHLAQIRISDRCRPVVNRVEAVKDFG